MIRFMEGYKAPTEHDKNINTIRTVNFVRESVNLILKVDCIAELNDGFTRGNVVDDIHTMLNRLAQLRIITWFDIVCDETNNSIEMIKNGRLSVSVQFTPAKTSEHICLDWTVCPGFTSGV